MPNLKSFRISGHGAATPNNFLDAVNYFQNLTELDVVVPKEFLIPAKNSSNDEKQQNQSENAKLEKFEDQHRAFPLFE